MSQRIFHIEISDSFLETGLMRFISAQEDGEAAMLAAIRILLMAAESPEGICIDDAAEIAARAFLKEQPVCTALNALIRFGWLEEDQSGRLRLSGTAEPFIGSYTDGTLRKKAQNARRSGNEDAADAYRNAAAARRLR